MRLRPAILLLALLAFPPAARAQVAVEAVAVEEDPLALPKQQPGFQVPLNEEVLSSFGDLQRYIERKDWERALRVLDDMPAEKRLGMLPRSDGWQIPARERFWQLLADLPAEGRAAFRVFQDAKARKLYEAALVGGDQAAAKMMQVYQDYFLTSVGDDAANWLGDSYFERGAYLEAVACWQAILDHSPESEIPELRLHVKRGLAYALAGQIDQAARVQRQLAERFAGQTVSLGGQEVPADKFLADMLARAISKPTVTTPDGPAPLGRIAAPRTPTDPDWQIQFCSKAGREKLLQSARQNSWYRCGMETLVPAYAIDGERLYCNWFGLCFAVDLETGKLLWRTAKFTDLHDKFEGMQQRQMTMEGFAILATNDAVYAVLVPPEMVNQWQPPMRLFCFHPKTGEKKWSSDQANGLANLSFLGQPLLHEGALYVLTHQQGNAELSLRALDPATGQPRWDKSLGTLQMLQQTNGQPRYPIPQLLPRGNTLFILTNNGALVEFDLIRREIASVLRYEGPETTSNRNQVFWSGNYNLDDLVALHVTGRLIERDGVLYLKEAGSRMLLAIDPVARTVLWKRPLDKSATIVGIDDRYLFTMNREVMAIDRETKNLVWSRGLDIQGAGLSLAVGNDTVLVMTGRGLFELSKDSGDDVAVFRGSDLDSVGGWIRTAGGRLINVSNLAVTAYPLPVDTAQAAVRSIP